MKTHFSAAFILFFILSAILSGCGSDGGQTSSASAVAASQMCIGCHAGSISPVTGESITVEWQRSKHQTGNGAGCYDCHAQPHAVFNCVACHTDIHKTHANSCGQCHGGSTNLADCRGCHATVHAGFAKQCLDCHTVPVLGAPHFNSNNSGVTHNAQFMDAQNSYTCKNCHNPHDNTVLAAAKAWATSAHGDVKGPAWTAKDFKADKDCIRCHTATGFVGYVTTIQAFTPPIAPLTTSSTYGVLGCNACHKNYNFTNHTSVRKIPAFRTPYNNFQFPNVGDSNLCIPCHSGIVSGDAINVNAVSDFSNAKFITSHNMAAAATMYLANAFNNFTTLTAPAATGNELSSDGTKATFASNKSYAQTLLPADTGKGGVGASGVAGGVTSAHRALGTAGINLSENYLKIPGSYAYNYSINTNGPCVTCHMQADHPVDSTGLAAALPAIRTGAGHSLQIDADAMTQVCNPCHAESHLNGGDGHGTGLYTQLTKDTIRSVMIEPQSEAFQNGLNLIKQLLLVKYMIKFDPKADPYFFDLQKDVTGKTAVTDWTRRNVALASKTDSLALGLTPIPDSGLTQMQAARLMGACFNLNLLARDPGAFVHARTFSQRLVYDMVDYLDNNLMDFTVLATARTLSLQLPATAGLANIYVGTNRNVFASDGTLATESMAWLAGTHYTDNNGAKPPVSLKGTNTLYPLRLRP